MKNFWQENAPVLADAYVRNAGPVQFELVSRALFLHMPATPQRVVDVGGGFGRQAIILARAGHQVLIIDVDSKMLEVARNQLQAEPGDISARVDMIRGDGADAVRLAGTGFDLACCHSVLMYQEDPVPLLHNLVGLVRPGGLISVLSINSDAIAMRTGLQGRWKETAASLESGIWMDSQYLPVQQHCMGNVIRILESAGALPLAWYGVGVFTDHLTERIVVDDPKDV